MTLPNYSRVDPAVLSFLDEKYGTWKTQTQDLPLSGDIQAQRKVSRQAATSLLNRLTASGVLAEGKGLRPKTHELKRTDVFKKTYSLDGLEEHVVWHNDLEPILANYAGERAMRIWNYGVTEMLNNAIDHSEGTEVTVGLSLTAVYAGCSIEDNGEGIFRRIKRLCDLPDERQAILELSKGKLTTAPQAHTGEGIFFTSRAMDLFDLDSYGISFNHAGGDLPDFLLENDFNVEGTCVLMNLNHRTHHDLPSLFNQYAGPDSFSFNKTVVPVRLAKIGAESLVSRSQARRLVSRIEKFETVMFDFTEVDFIGQAFADEIFRVFQNAHPDVRLEVVQANGDVMSMIKRAKAHES